MKVGNIYYVTCPLCGENFSVITRTHLKHKHNTTMAEFLKEFPKMRLHTDSLRESITAEHYKTPNNYLQNHYKSLGKEVV